MVDVPEDVQEDVQEDFLDGYNNYTFGWWIFDCGFRRIKREMTSMGDKTMDALENVLVDRAGRATRRFLQEELKNTPRKKKLSMIEELTRK